MGWSFSNIYTERSDRKEFIASIVKKSENDEGIWESLASCLRGCNLWSVMQVTNKKTGEIKKFIMLYMIEYRSGSWGYKDIDEGMGPNSLSCPPKYIGMADAVEPDSYAGKWRAEVLRVQAEKKVNRDSLKKNFNAVKNTINHCILTLKNSTVKEVVVVNFKPLEGVALAGEHKGRRFRVSRKYIGESRTMTL